MELQIRNLSKRYPNGVEALKKVTLTIPQGMYGLLGPNGAGKSTLMRTLATLQEPDEGSVRLGDIDVLHQKDRLRETLGYLPQERGERGAVAGALRRPQGHRRAELAQGGGRGAASPDESLGGAQGEARRLLGRDAAALRGRGRAARRYPDRPSPLVVDAVHAAAEVRPLHCRRLRAGLPALHPPEPGPLGRDPLHGRGPDAEHAGDVSRGRRPADRLPPRHQVRAGQPAGRGSPRPVPAAMPGTT
jgi:hypothetical protein